MHLERNNPRNQYMLGTDQLESCLAEKDLPRVLVNTKLDMSQHCGLTAQQWPFATKKANDIAVIRRSVSSRSREVSLLCSALVRPHLQCWIQSWAPQYERHTEESSGKCHEDDAGAGASLLWGKAEIAGTVQSGDEKAQGGSHQYM